MYQLHVRVIEARDLANYDFLDKSDPYCILRVNGREDRTRTISNNLNPVWNQEFHFDTPSPQMGVLEIRVKDKDGGLRGRDDDMSTLNIQFSQIPVGQVIDNWYSMTPCKSNKRGGMLHLVLNILPVGTPPFTNLMGGYPPQGGYQPCPAQGYPPRGYPPGPPPGCYPPGPPPGFYPPGPPPRGFPPGPPPGYPPRGYPPGPPPPGYYPPGPPPPYRGYPPRY